MNNHIEAIGAAVMIQTMIRYGAYVAIFWISLSFIDGWVMAYLSQSN